MHKNLEFLKEFFRDNFFRILTQDRIKLIVESEKWTVDQINEYHLQHLISLLKECSKHVPFYKNLFKKIGFSPCEFKKLSDINDLPFLEKDLVRICAKSIVNEKFKKRVRKVKSGGTTGQPLEFYSCKIHHINWFPYANYLFALSGGSFLGECIRWRGVNIDSHLFNENYRFNPLTKFMLCKSSDLSDKYIESCFSKAKKAGIQSIQGYPSVLNVLSLHNLERGTPISFKRAYATSEIVLPVHREVVKKAFGCRLFSFYGQSELTAIATECENSEDYHFLPSFSYVELIGEDGNPVTKDGEIGEIVGTTFQTPAFPLIRYRTGDYGVLSTSKCQCRRSWLRCSKIIGRKGEYIHLKSGIKLPLTALINGPRHAFLCSIKKFSFYQERNGYVVFYVIKSDQLSNSEKDGIVASLQNVVKDGELIVKVVQVNNIPTTRNQKHKLLLTSEDVKNVS